MPGSRRNLWIAAAALAVAAVAAAVVLLVATHRQAVPGSAPTAIGKVIFQSGIGPDGGPVPRTVSGGGAGMMGGAMMSAGCASCHGTDGHGLTTQQFASPNITYANLTDPKGMVAPDGTRGATYTDATLRRAIEQGLDPEGHRLDWPMPRWRLTSEEWDGLLAYLKTLH